MHMPLFILEDICSAEWNVYFATEPCLVRPQIQFPWKLTRWARSLEAQQEDKIIIWKKFK